VTSGIHRQLFEVMMAKINNYHEKPEICQKCDNRNKLLNTNLTYIVEAVNIGSNATEHLNNPLVPDFCCQMQSCLAILANSIETTVSKNY
jgi:hypothetical protein